MKWPVLITVTFRGNVEAETEDEAREKVEASFKTLKPDVAGFELEGLGPEEVDAQNLFMEESE